MLFVYPAIFHHEDESYWVEFPDLPGCQTFGSSINETVEYAQEALSGYLITVFKEGPPLPAPSEPASIACDSNSFVALVSCDINQYKDTKAVKKTLTIPSWLNDRATAMGINFSQVLQDALINKIQYR